MKHIFQQGLWTNPLSSHLNVPEAEVTSCYKVASPNDERLILKEALPPTTIFLSALIFPLLPCDSLV